MLSIIIKIVHVVVSFFLILVVLAQQGKGQDLASAFGGGGSQAAFGARGTATLLSKITAGAAALFMITSLTLSYLRPSTGSGTVIPESPATSETTLEDSEITTPSADDEGLDTSDIHTDIEEQANPKGQDNPRQ